MSRNLNRKVVPFGGGLNNKFNEFRIKDNEASDMLNCIYVDSNAIAKRTGYTLEGDDTGSTKILGLHAHYESGGTKELVRSTGTAFQYLTGGSWTNVDTGFTTGLDTNYVTVNDKTYIFNGTDNVHSYAGGGAALTDHTTNIPKGKFAVWWRNMLFVAGVSGNESTLYVSALGDPEDFTDSFTVADYETEITGIVGFAHMLLVFERTRVWAITGYQPLSLSNTPREESIGAINHRSIQSIGGSYVLFQDEDGHVRKFNGSVVDPKPISYEISTTIDALKDTLISDSAAVFFDEKYHLAVPKDSTSTFNDFVLVYDVTRDAWTLFDGVQASCWAQFRDNNINELFFGEADADSKVYEMYQGTSDNSSAINFYYTTKAFDCNAPQAEKKFKTFYLDVFQSGDHDVKVEYALDGGAFATLGTINLATDGWVLGTSALPVTLGSQALVQDNTLIIPNRGRYIKFRFSNNAADEEVTIYSSEFWFRYKRVKKRLQSVV